MFKNIYYYINNFSLCNSPIILRILLIFITLQLFEKRQVLFLCDIWYPKKEVIDLVETIKNLELFCSVRTDIVLYDLPPAPFYFIYHIKLLIEI